MWHLTTEVGHSVRRRRRRRRRRKETVRLKETELELKRKNIILQGLRFRDIKTCLTTSPRLAVPKAKRKVKEMFNLKKLAHTQKN